MRTVGITLCLFSALALVVGCEKSGGASASPAEGNGDDHEVEAGGVDAEAEPGPEPAAETTLTVTLFEETVQANMQDAADCFAEARAANEKLGGKLVADFTIDGEGTVTEITASGGSTLTDEGLLKCIRDRAAGWELAPPPGKTPTNMRFPFEFGSAG